MLIGHFAVALGVKRYVPGISLGTLFMAAQFSDLLWPWLLLLGFEDVAIDSSASAVTPLIFEHFPISHSLVSVTVWGFVAAILVQVRYREWKSSLIVAGLVISHWFLDVIVHVPDMPVFPSGPELGLGVWNSFPATILLELILVAAGFYLYFRGTSPVNRMGLVASVLLALVLPVLFFLNLLGPVPTTQGELIVGAQFLWLIVILGYFTDHRRNVSDGIPNGRSNYLNSFNLVREVGK